jgi:probable phosphoglycerate mutase
MSRLILVRHGENHANLTKEFSYRRVDYPLTLKGRLQAEQTAAALARWPSGALFASPLRRAQETAAIIGAALGLPVQLVEDLREVNVGALEGSADLAAAWTVNRQVVAAWRAGQTAVRYPDGENLLEFVARLQRAITYVVHHTPPHQPAIVVGHGGMFSLALPSLCPNFPRDPGESHNCSLSEIEMHPTAAGWQGEVVSWSRCDHLSGAAAELVSGLPEADFFPPPTAT